MKFNDVYKTLQASSPATMNLNEAKESDNYKPINLPYELNALEPHISKETMTLHYNKHYKGYINKLNELTTTRKPLEQFITGAPKNEKVRFNLGGAYNHQIFWMMLSAEKTNPKGELLEKIERKYGSLDQLYEKFRNEALSIMGSGWCWLVHKDNKLNIVTTPNQDNPLMDNLGTPILGLDMWEHAYYIDYGPDKDKYITNFLKLINWNYGNIIISS